MWFQLILNFLVRKIILFSLDNVRKIDFFLALVHGPYPNTQVLPHPQLPSAPPLYDPQNNNDQYGKSQAPPLPSK